MYQPNLKTIVEEYKRDLSPDKRFASFDYCYNYFKASRSAAVEDNVEQSCLTIAFYLASWGMMRGSSFLLNKSLVHFKPLVTYIDGLDKKVWDIDVDDYSDEKIRIILEIYRDVKQIFVSERHADLTLVTKILLGVFGFIPAFDSYFCNTFRVLTDGKSGFRSVNESSLKFIAEFYQANKDVVDGLSESTSTIDFRTGTQTNLNYPKAKIIDMYGFQRGFVPSINPNLTEQA